MLAQAETRTAARTDDADLLHRQLRSAVTNTHTDTSHSDTTNSQTLGRPHNRLVGSMNSSKSHTTQSHPHSRCPHPNPAHVYSRSARTYTHFCQPTPRPTAAERNLSVRCTRVAQGRRRPPPIEAARVSSREPLLSETVIPTRALIEDNSAAATICVQLAGARLAVHRSRGRTHIFMLHTWRGIFRFLRARLRRILRLLRRASRHILDLLRPGLHGILCLLCGVRNSLLN